MTILIWTILDRRTIMVEQLNLFVASVQEDNEPRKKVDENYLQKQHDKKYTQRKLKPSEVGTLFECGKKLS